MHLLLATAIMGTALNYLGYFVMETSGSVVLKLLGSIRTMGLVVFSFLFRGEYVGAYMLVPCGLPRKPPGALLH